MRKVLLLLMLAFFCNQLFAQSNNNKIKVFLDCSWMCDFDYVRNEMKMVDFVRDRFDADVHVLVNSQHSSSGGTQPTLIFIGQKNFSNQQDTLSYFNDPTTTQDDQRKKMVKYLKFGLVRYLSKTSVADQLEINYSAPSANGKTETPVNDKWNNWVYQLGTNGNINGSQNYKQHSVYGYFSADKETEKWKINLNASANREVQTFIQDSVESKFVRKQYSAYSNVARAIDQHWSYGLSADFKNSLFSNIRSGISFKPKIEYSLLPYSRYNTERIVVDYEIGPVYNNYYDSTIFLKTHEVLMQQGASLISSFTKPWGTLNLGMFFNAYFDDFSKNQLQFIGAVTWKIFKGFNFGIYGNYGLIHDQIGLRKGSFTRDELLVKNRELKSSFEYNLGMGISYRFGSIMNNIVNPRFKGLSYSISF
ncbi:MAG: hypothetical protein ACM3VS_13850 [Candidatus Dadabacteria bacterium]